MFYYFFNFTLRSIAGTLSLGLEGIKRRLNELEEGKKATVPVAPVIQENSFTFERKALSVEERTDRHYNYQDYRPNTIQYEMVKKQKTNKQERNAGLCMIKTSFFANNPTHENINLLVNDYHSPFHSFDSLVQFWRKEQELMDLLIDIDDKQMISTHLAKSDKVADQQREVLEQMKRDIKEKLHQLTNDKVGDSSDYLHRFVQEVIFSIFPVEQEYDVFIVKPRSLNPNKSLYSEQVINRYQYFFCSSQSILLENEEKTMAILICLKKDNTRVPYQITDYKERLGFKTYYNYMNIR